MKNILNLYKPEGETPLETILRFKGENPSYEDIPMTYAGRLDPMAEGLLLVLVGEECKKKEEYLGLDKEYEVEVLFGVETDSYDVLGVVYKVCKVYKVESEKIKKELKSFVGKFTQEYPAFSSKTVGGRPLFEIARAKDKNSAKSDEVVDEMPTKEVEIYSIKVGKMRKISAKKLLSDMEKRISRVTGDFRQKEILKLWKKVLKESNDQYEIIKLKVKCSSGTYMRSLAHNLGKKLGVGAVAYSIKRTKIGGYKI